MNQQKVPADQLKYGRSLDFDDDYNSSFFEGLFNRNKMKCIESGLSSCQRRRGLIQKIVGPNLSYV